MSKVRTGAKVGGNRRPKRYRDCPTCGASFEVKQARHRFCSPPCGYAAARTGREPRQRPTAEARRAHSHVAYLLRSGKLTRPDRCEDCGEDWGEAKRIEAAHYTYAEPARVRWLCRPCHVRWDKAQPKGGTVKSALPSDGSATTPEPSAPSSEPTE